MLVAPMEGPQVTLQKTAYIWSFTKYKVWKECQERYLREYLQRQRIPPLSQKPFLQGSVAHNLIEAGREAVLAGETTDLEGWCQEHLPKIFDHHAAKVTDWEPGEIDHARVEAAELATKYVQLVTENALLTGHVLCEHPLGTYKNPLWLPNGVGLVGYIDWAKLDGDASIVLDAKSSRNTRYLDREQLVLYAVALEALYGVEVKRVAWMMIRWGQTLWFDITTEEKERLQANLLTASRQVAGLDLRYEPHEQLCLPCPHSGVCGRYQHWLIEEGGVVRLETAF